MITKYLNRGIKSTGRETVYEFLITVEDHTQCGPDHKRCLVRGELATGTMAEIDRAAARLKESVAAEVKRRDGR